MKYKLEFEYLGPFSTEWVSTHRETGDWDDIRDQYNQLRQWEAKFSFADSEAKERAITATKLGQDYPLQPIRNVKLFQSPTTEWVEIQEDESGH